MDLELFTDALKVVSQQKMLEKLHDSLERAPMSMGTITWKNLPEIHPDTKAKLLAVLEAEMTRLKQQFDAL